MCSSDLLVWKYPGQELGFFADSGIEKMSAIPTILHLLYLCPLARDYLPPGRSHCGGQIEPVGNSIQWAELYISNHPFPSVTPQRHAGQNSACCYR